MDLNTFAALAAINGALMEFLKRVILKPAAAKFGMDPNLYAATCTALACAIGVGEAAFSAGSQLVLFQQFPVLLNFPVPIAVVVFGFGLGIGSAGFNWLLTLADNGLAIIGGIGAFLANRTPTPITNAGNPWSGAHSKTPVINRPVGGQRPEKG